MRKTIGLVFIHFALLVIVLLGADYGVFAQDLAYSTRVSPATQRFVVVPDFEVIESRITIENLGEDALFQVKSSASSESILVDLLELSREQRWSKIESPLLIKSKESKLVMTMIKRISEEALEEKDYYVDTFVTMMPVYSPLTSSKLLHIEPKLRSKATLSVTKTAKTENKAKVAFFTNLTGPVILSDTTPQIVLLMQNLNKYSLVASGTIEVKNGNDTRTFDIIPTSIEANNQSYLTNIISEGVSIDLGKSLPAGKYELSAKINVGQTDAPTVFSNYTIWVLPHALLYIIVISLIVMLVGLLVSHFVSLRN